MFCERGLTVRREGLPLCRTGLRVLFLKLTGLMSREARGLTAPLPSGGKLITRPPILDSALSKLQGLLETSEVRGGVIMPLPNLNLGANTSKSEVRREELQFAELPAYTGDSEWRREELSLSLLVVSTGNSAYSGSKEYMDWR